MTAQKTNLPGDAGTDQGGPAAQPAGRPSQAQLRYLRCGLDQAGGKLPLFDDDGQEFSAKTIRACIEKGWAEPWFDNPAKPNWLVCKLTETGRQVADPDGNP